MFGFLSPQALKMKKIQKVLGEINKVYETIQPLSNDELRNKVADLAARIQSEMAEMENAVGELRRKLDYSRDMDVIAITRLYQELEKKENEKFELSESVLEKHIPLGFALVKSTCYRFATSEAVRVTANEYDIELAKYRDNVQVEGDFAIYNSSWAAGGKFLRWNMIPYDSQLMAAIVLQQGEIAEMLNGEGKTLASLFPLFLSGIARRKIFVCTANPFLSGRDCHWMRPVLEFLGLTVSLIDTTDPNTEARKNCYQADIVYGNADEFGFDYLRDNMVHSQDEMVQPEPDCALIDEIDSILIDNARTPLIISGPIAKKDQVLHQYRELQPAVEALVKKQMDILDRYFEKAKELVEDEEYNEACRNLYRIHKGNPRYYALHYYLNTTPQILSKLNKFEKKMVNEKPDDSLFEGMLFTIENGDIEFLEEGKEFIDNITGEDNFWEVPDIDREMIEIASEDITIIEQIEKKRNLLDKFEYIQERHKIINQLIKAYTSFIKDVDYVVSDGLIKLVDSVTGRVLPGRTYGDGMHQAIEAKENLPISMLAETYATISLQSYFLKYKKIAGMTATAKIDESEYRNIYDKKVVVIPPFKPTIRKDFPEKVYRTKREKLNALVDEVIAMIRANRPVLIGTTTVEDSEIVSTQLENRGIEHHLLNAKQDEQEALIIAQAGQPRMVTVAALMAGRGTDIKLTNESKASGGLAVLGFEKHESRRMDHQLKGRAGRQGDPGSSLFFVSLEDKLLRMFGSDNIAVVMDKLGYVEGEVIQHSMISASIERSQKKTEEHDLAVRSRLYEYDNSLNLAREGIYQKRNHAISGYRIKLDVRLMFDDVSKYIIKISGESYENLKLQVLNTFGYTTAITPQELMSKSEKSLADQLSIESYNSYMYKTEELARNILPVLANIRKTQGAHIENVVIPFSGKLYAIQVLVRLDKALFSEGWETTEQFQAQVIIAIIDKYWKIFLKRYNKIKEDITLISAIQKADPLFLFKKNIGEYYEELLTEIHFEIVNCLCCMQIPIGTSNENKQPEEDADVAEEPGTNTDAETGKPVIE